MSIKRNELESFLTTLYNLNEYQDYGPNGLQIEGKDEISKIAFAVSATRHSVAQAVKQNADALIVHHGLIWGFQSARAFAGPITKRFFPI
ncbi:MAG: Nif3-like dinuclear metal center hexameric protein, partial [Bacteriovoracia bacterium]